ncbi:MAG: hypothetical protein PVS3B3_35040 [Ktedonobacteraceae bacterium]
MVHHTHPSRQQRGQSGVLNRQLNELSRKIFGGVMHLFWLFIALSGFIWYIPFISNRTYLEVSEWQIY